MRKEFLIAVMLLGLVFAAPKANSEFGIRNAEFGIGGAAGTTPHPSASPTPSPQGEGRGTPSVACGDSSLGEGATPSVSFADSSLGEGACGRMISAPTGVRERDRGVIPHSEFRIPHSELTVWWTEEDAAIIAAVVLGECPYCGDRQQDLTAACVVNRVFHESLGSTVREVVCWPGQYSPWYAVNVPDPEDPDETVQRAFAAAYRALRGQVDCPLDLIYQANFEQGRETWEVIEFQSRWFSSTTYFCRG